MALMRIALLKGKCNLRYPSSEFVTPVLYRFARSFHESPALYFPRTASKKHSTENEKQLEDDFPVINEQHLLENDSDLFGIESDEGALCFNQTIPPNLEKFNCLVAPKTYDSEVVCVTSFGQIRRDIDNLPGSRRSLKDDVTDLKSRMKRKYSRDLELNKRKSDQLTTKQEAYDLYSNSKQSEDRDRQKRERENQETDTVQEISSVSQNEIYSTGNTQSSVMSKLNRSADFSRTFRSDHLKLPGSKKASSILNKGGKHTVAEKPMEISEVDVKVSTSNHLSNGDFDKRTKDNVSYIDECCFGDRYSDSTATFDPNLYSQIEGKSQPIDNRVMDEHKMAVDVEKPNLKTSMELVRDPAINLSENRDVMKTQLVDNVSYVDQLYFPGRYGDKEEDTGLNTQNLSKVSNQKSTESDNQESLTHTEKMPKIECSLLDDRVGRTLLNTQNYVTSDDSFIDKVYFSESQEDDGPATISNISPRNQYDSKTQTNNISSFAEKSEYKSPRDKKKSSVESKKHLPYIEDKLSDSSSGKKIDKILAQNKLEAEKRDEHTIVKNEKDLDKKDEIKEGSALDYVMKLKKATQIRSSVIKDGDLPKEGGDKRDSKGFRILTDQVANLSKLTREELLIILKNRIVFENEDVVILNKPYNLVVHDGKTNKDPNLSSLLDDLAQMLEKQVPNPKLFTVHRLDKETTGCILLARNEITAQHLKRLFAERKILKTYWIVTGRIPDPLQGVIDIPIAEGIVDKKARMVLHPILPEDMNYKSHAKHGKRAVTHYRVLSTSGNAALIEVKPETGVKHQIRVHFGFGLGCPILGDHKYSHLDKMAPQKLPSDLLQRLGVRQSKVRHVPIHIHARSIVIPQMLSGRSLYGFSPLPTHMAENLQRLKFRKNP